MYIFLVKRFKIFLNTLVHIQYIRFSQLFFFIQLVQNEYTWVVSIIWNLAIGDSIFWGGWLSSQGWIIIKYSQEKQSNKHNMVKKDSIPDCKRILSFLEEKCCFALDLSNNLNFIFFKDKLTWYLFGNKHDHPKCKILVFIYLMDILGQVPKII